jgi:phosphatidylinositol kinase/protein kinase (PI-3  family)
MMVMLMFDTFNFLWQNSGLKVKPKVLTFKILPASPCFGFMEFVENSASLRDFNFTRIANYSDMEMEAFLTTSSASYVAGFVLGIRDRHEDNLMIQDGYKFFQLDFKHAFNEKTFGIDSCRFAVPAKLKKALLRRDKWQNFKFRCQGAYMILRRNWSVIVELSRILFRDLFPDSEIEIQLKNALYLDRSEEEALTQIDSLIESGVRSWKRKLKNVVHERSPNVSGKFHL